MSTGDGPPSVPGGRTPEEREQARREREARRAARSGADRPSPERSGRGPSAPAPPETRAVVADARSAPAHAGPAPDPEGRTADDRPHAQDDGEPLAPVRRRPFEPRGTPARAPSGPGGSGRGGTTRGSAGDASAPRPRRRIGLRVLLALALLLALSSAGALAVSLLQPEPGGAKVRVEIPNGAGVSDIGDLLERRGVVSSGTIFELRATLAGRRGELRPGAYELTRGMAYGSAIDVLAAGPPVRRPPVVNVTIPEGRSRREIAPVVSRAGIRGSYREATVRSPELRPRRYGAGRVRDLEGFLFPATYELRRRAGARTLVRKQLQAFEREFAKVDMKAARRRNLTPYDVLIIASMVEREAQVASERPTIAAVIYNRLRQGIPLGIDATVRFVTGNWTRPLRESQLAVDSPYNTRTRAGLPPGPIGNPGLASMRAAARPARTDFLYYVVKPGTCGEHAFSSTAAEFERDVARYNSARARRGGKSPTSC